MRDRVLALSRVNVERHLQQVMRRRNAAAEGVAVDPASAGEAEIAAPPADLALDLDERVKVGLVTLCTREKELYLEQFEQQILSRRMVAVLAADADRLIDGVRDKGAAGYEEWMEDISRPDLGFRVALWLHRRLGLRALPDPAALADRFEILMVSQSVLAELAAFNIKSVPTSWAATPRSRLAAVIDNRQDAAESALKALSLQYPGYAEAIQARQLERAAIRFESAEYSRAPARGHHQPRGLRRPASSSLPSARGAIVQRPPLDLGLELAGMIARVPIFASLDRAAVVEVGKRLRAVVALPGEKIIGMGGQARRHVLHRRGRGDGEGAAFRGDPEGGRLRRRDGAGQRPGRAAPT